MLAKHLLCFLKSFSDPANDDPNRMVVGQSKHWSRETIGIDSQSLSGHTLLVGPAGSTTKIVVENVLTQQTRAGLGWIYFDATGNDALKNRLYAEAAAAGREHQFHVLAPWSHDGSESIDLLSYGDPGEAASILMALLPISGEEAIGDGFYRQSIHHVLTVLITAFRSIGAPFGVEELLKTLQSEAAVDALSAQLKSKRAIDLVRLMKATFCGKNGFSATRYQEVTSGIASRLAHFQTDQTNSIFNSLSPEIRFDKILASGEMVYIQMPIMSKHLFATNFARLMLAAIQSSIREGLRVTGSIASPFLMVMDEFLAYDGAAPALPYLAAKAGVGLVWVSQSIDGLEFASTDVSRAETRICFGGYAGARSPEEVAGLMGMDSLDASVKLKSLAPGEFLIAQEGGTKVGRVKRMSPIVTKTRKAA